MCDFLLEKVNVHVFFKQKDKVYDSQVRICLSLLWLQVRIWLFFRHESACVTVKMTSEWSFWLVNFKVTISGQTLSLNQPLHVFWALTLKCLLSHMMLIQIPWPTQEVISSHIHRQLHNLGRGRRSFKSYPKWALFTGHLILRNGAISHNWPQIASDRTIWGKSHNS